MRLLVEIAKDIYITFYWEEFLMIMECDYQKF